MSPEEEMRLRLQAQSLRQPHFETRAENVAIFPMVKNSSGNDDGTQSTHRMAAEIDDNGQWWAFPTIQQSPDGEMVEFEDAFEALRAAKKSGNAKPMKKEEAIEYARGGYKKGTLLDKDLYK